MSVGGSATFSDVKISTLSAVSVISTMTVSTLTNLDCKGLGCSPHFEDAAPGYGSKLNAGELISMKPLYLGEGGALVSTGNITAPQIFVGIGYHTSAKSIHTHDLTLAKYATVDAAVRDKLLFVPQVPPQ